MAWVPPEKRDSAWWLFQKLFHCRVNNLQMQSPDYIKYYGTPDSGDETANAQMRAELIDIRIPIAQMAEYYAQDIPVIIPDPKVTKEIYERVMDHLRVWKREMDESLNPGTLPEILDDLIKFDNFAAALFPHAKRFFDPDFGDSKFARKLGGIVSITKGSFMARTSKAAAEPEEAETVKHEGFGSAFQERKQSLSGRRWK